MSSLFEKPRLTRIVEWIATQGGVPFFVETGTDVGETCLVAADFFEKVFTVENDRDKFIKFYKRMYNPSRRSLPVLSIYGDSPATLRDVILPALKMSPAVFWLDCHQRAAPAGSPILRELDVIRAWGGPAILLIDDYFLFSLQPEDTSQQIGWPAVRQIFDKLKGMQRMCLEDVIVAVSPSFMSLHDLVTGHLENVMGSTRFD